MAKTKIQREIEKKEIRRKHEKSSLKDYQIDQSSPFQPKKPMEFKFERNDIETCNYPVEIGNGIAEKKSDGFCSIVSIDHKSAQPYRFFSAAGTEWNPECYPDITQDLREQPSMMVHAELVGLEPRDVETLTSLEEFTAVQRRPRDSTRFLTQDMLDEYPLKLDVFDILMVEGQSMLDKPFRERRAVLEDMVKQSRHVNVVKQWYLNSGVELQELFLNSVKRGLEGLIVKDPESLYIPGSRDSDWLKLKDFVTFDLAVLGFYDTPESRKIDKPFSAILAGTYNQETGKYETLVKVGVGSVKEQEAIYERMGRLVDTSGDYIKVVKANSLVETNPAMAKIERKVPNRIAVYEDGHVPIVEIQCLDVTYSKNWHSCGLDYDGTKAHSLRIGSYKQLRTDKTRAKDVTTTQQIHDYYLGNV